MSSPPISHETTQSGAAAGFDPGAGPAFDAESRWDEAWDALGAVPRTGLMHTLVARHCERHRKVYTVQFLRGCLAAYERLASSCERPHEVLLALWFHRAVWRASAEDNCVRSATLAHASIVKSGGDEAAAQRVAALIRAVRYHGPAPDADARAFHDAALWPLACDQPRFAAHEAAHRAEQPRLAGHRFARLRLERLAALEARDVIFRTDAFRDPFEARARENVSSASRKYFHTVACERSLARRIVAKM